MHYYEKNVVEIKQEYTNFLTNILTPFIYEGIKSLYDAALKEENNLKEKAIHDPNVQILGVLKIFQMYLRDIQNLNNHAIQTETERIKEKSKCSEWFDDLIKAVIKSNIILLTYNASGKKCKLVNQKHHENIQTESFIHKCYIECARSFFNYPEIFYHKYSNIDIKRNQREAYDIIKNAISEAIRKMLPIKLILKEYLKNDYIDDNNDIGTNIPQSRYTNIRSLVKRDLTENEDEIRDFYDNNPKYNNYKNYSESYKIIDSDDNIYDSNYSDDQDESNKYNDEKNENVTNTNLYTENNDKTQNVIDDTELEKNISKLDKIVDNDINNDKIVDVIDKQNINSQYVNNEQIETNATENLNDLILGKEETNLTAMTDENKIIKQTDFNNNEKNNNENQPYDYSKGLKILESIKKPKDTMTDIINKYVKNNNTTNNIKSIKTDELNNIIDNIENKNNIHNIENINSNTMYVNKDDDDDINIKINNKINKEDIKK